MVRFRLLFLFFHSWKLIPVRCQILVLLEIDLLVVNNENVVVIECKSNLSVEDVNDHLERLEKVKRLLPRYNNCKVLGGVAGMVIPDNVATYAIKKGLYVIGQNGDHLELRNEQSFTAKAW